LVPAQQRVEGVECAALLDARDDVRDVLRGHDGAAPRAVARVVREVHGVHGQHFDPDALHGEDGGAVAGVSVRDGRLDREDLHPSIMPPLTYVETRSMAWGRR